MDLNTYVDPVIEPTGPSAVGAYVVGAVAGTAVALPVLMAVFGL